MQTGNSHYWVRICSWWVSEMTLLHFHFVLKNPQKCLKTPYPTQHYCTKLQYFPNKTSNQSLKAFFMALNLNSEMFCYTLFIEKWVWNSLLSDFYYLVTVFFENLVDFLLKLHLPIESSKAKMRRYINLLSIAACLLSSAGKRKRGRRRRPSWCCHA